MSPTTTRSRASNNAVVTSVLHGGGKGGSGSGKGGSSGGKGGSVSSKGKSGGGTELFATGAAMSPTPPAPTRKAVATAAGAHYKLCRSGGAASGSADSDTDDWRCATEGDRKLPANDGRRRRADSRLLGELDPTRARRDKKSCPKVFDVEDDDEQVDITHDNQVSKFGEQFHVHTIIREDIFVGQKFADFDIDLSFSNLPTSI